ncbi:MAG TPA: tetratricopeptide repeat protein [Stellaceae bacterium]|nr:tetratricopeptide repeat protein [Stellaceae bacterium]
MMRARLAAVFLLAMAAPGLVAGPAGAVELPAASEPLLTVPPVPSARAPRPAAADAATYERCMSLAGHDAAAAKKLALGWQARGGAHPAEHCLAVALIGLQQYKEAASRLETLAQAMVRAPEALRAEVLDQAGQAWLLAGDPGRAYEAGGRALSLRPNDPDLLVDRAEAAGAAGWFDKALADLDRALKAHPERLDALIYRATAYRELGRLDPALADVDAALALAPDSVPALLERGNIRRLRGDVEGARADWGKAAALAPGSAAEAAARANIERLAIPQQLPPAAKPPAGGG